MPLDGAVPAAHPLEMADEAYDFVLAKLPKYRQAELAALTGGDGARGGSPPVCPTALG